MPRERIAELDLLRFTAALSVVLFHVVHWPSQPTVLSSVTDLGFLGVPLFFMISGFVILMTAQHRDGMEFVNSRIARLYPSFWICVLLTALALAVLGNKPPSLAVVAANLTMQPRMLFNQPYLDPVYWTLVVEMKFYLLIWLLIVTKQMQRIETFLTLWLGSGVLATVVHFPDWLNALLIPMWASLFVGGCYLYLIRSRGVTVRRLATFGVSVVTSMYWSLQYQSVYTHSTTLGTQLAVLAVVLLMAVAFLLLAMRKWSLPPARIWFWLGCLTYPLYLTHATAGRLVWESLAGNEWLRVWVALALVFLVSIVLAVVIERRACGAFNRLLNRVTQRMLERLGLREEGATAMR
jgi:peptidoglycan/LPS O-acetylase OafA/YrhL